MRKSLQKRSIQNFYLTHKFVSDKIDDYRSEKLFLKKNFFFKLKLKNLRILHVTNFNERLDGRLFCNDFLNLVFLIRFIIDFVRFFSLSFFNIFASVTVSGKPPLFVIITAQPLAAASKLVLPKGSSHLEQATVILVFLNISKTSLCFLKPSIDAFL